MRYVYATLIAFVVAVVVVFAFQNMGNVTITFLNASATLPLAVLVLLIYLFGILTGGSVLTVLGSWIRGAGRR